MLLKNSQEQECIEAVVVDHPDIVVVTFAPKRKPAGCEDHGDHIHCRHIDIKK